MAITQLHPGVLSGRCYGDFYRYGERVIPRYTQLHPGVMSGRCYGSFSRGSPVPPAQPGQPGQTGSGFGNRWQKFSNDLPDEDMPFLIAALMEVL